MSYVAIEIRFSEIEGNEKIKWKKLFLLSGEL